MPIGLNSMKKIYNKFLIVSTIALFIGGVYLYFSNNLNSGTIMPVAFGSSLASSTGALPLTVPTSAQDKISSDISFLTILASLKVIKIDTSIFADKSFNALLDNGVKLVPVAPGRINPFAPIDKISVVNATIQVSKVVTDEPTQITGSTVILNGTINTVSGVTDTYFEYGATTNLGTTTASVKQSLVGTFIKSVLGLNPKTNYFYKACANLDKVAYCGDVVSFTTN